MGSKANFQQAPVHWPREIIKAKLSQAKSFFIHIFLLNNGKRGRKGIFGQFWAVLGKLGQVWIRQQISKMGKKGRKNKKRDQKFEW